MFINLMQVVWFSFAVHPNIIIPILQRILKLKIVEPSFFFSSRGSPEQNQKRKDDFFFSYIKM